MPFSGMTLLSEKVTSFGEYPEPYSYPKIKHLPGSDNFYQRLISNCMKIIIPLTGEGVNVSLRFPRLPNGRSLSVKAPPP